MEVLFFGGGGGEPGVVGGGENEEGVMCFRREGTEGAKSECAAGLCRGRGRQT